MFIGRTDAEAETPVLWPPHVDSWLIGKDSDAERDWGQEEKGMTEAEMVGWHHWLDAHEFGWTLGAGDGQGGLACCGSWGRKESDTTERVNWTELTESSHRRSLETELNILTVSSCGWFLWWPAPILKLFWAPHNLLSANFSTVEKNSLWITKETPITQGIPRILEALWGFPGSSDGKASACNAEDLGLILGSRRSLEERNDNPLMFLPGESHGQRGLVGYSPWGRKELDRAVET